MSAQNPQDDQGSTDQVIHRGKFITVRARTVRKADGSESRYEIVEHAEAVAIVAVRYESHESGDPLIALVHQQRPAAGKETLELPAGLVEPHERSHPEQTAARELLEETGYTAATLRLLTREYSSPGFTDEAISIYLATDVEEAEGSPVPDPNEISKVQWVPLSEAMQLAREGEIDDGKTLIGLWLARDMLTADAFQN